MSSFTQKKKKKASEANNCSRAACSTQLVYTVTPAVDVKGYKRGEELEVIHQIRHSEAIQLLSKL